VETVADESSLAGLDREWEELERTSGHATPFLTVPWTRSWWRHVRECAHTVKDSLAIRVVRTERREIVAIAPFMLTERPASGPLRTRCLQFIGADPNWTEVRGVLCHPTMERPVYSALLQDLAQSAQDWDWVAWTGVRAESGAESALRNHVRFESSMPSYLLDLPSSWTALRARLPRNIKESLRKCYNSLKRDGLKFAFDVVTARAGMRAALDDFFRLHAARAARTDTVAHGNFFAEPRARSFLVEACERLAERDAARVFRLSIGGKLVATRIGFAANGSLYLYYSGYEPEYGRYSVMTTTLAEAIQYAISAGYRSVNLGSGADVSKARWHPREIVYRHGVQISPHLRGRLAHHAFSLATQTLRAPSVWRYAQRLVARRARCVGE
jgi:CelD/BcsL family acetyltransferase involved in cellulose biosynthesis